MQKSRTKTIEQITGKDMRSVLRDALAQDGTVVGAAKALGVDDGTIYRWLQRYGIPPPRKVESESDVV